MYAVGDGRREMPFCQLCIPVQETRYRDLLGVSIIVIVETKGMVQNDFKKH